MIKAWNYIEVIIYIHNPLFSQSSSQRLSILIYDDIYFVLVVTVHVVNAIGDGNAKSNLLDE